MEATEEKLLSQKKRKHIYAFTVNKQEEVEQEVTKKTEDGEEVVVKKKVEEAVPYRVITACLVDKLKRRRWNTALKLATVLKKAYLQKLCCQKV